MRKFVSAALIISLCIGSVPSVNAAGTVYMEKKEGMTPFRDGESSFEKLDVVPNTPIPKVLSDNDVRVYKRMFRLQRGLQRKKVVQLLPQLEDRILIGDLIAERILHPRTKTPYIDMKNWLADYNDQHQAKKIYRLANKRKPRRESHKKPSVIKDSLAQYNDPEAFLKEPEPSEVRKASKTRRKLLAKLKRYRQKQYYTKAMGIYKQPETMKILSRGTWQQAALKLAQTMMYDGYYQKAQDFAAYIAETTPESQPKALWVAGFSAYRLGQLETSAKLFRRLFYTVPKNSSYYARAAWWTAKANEELSYHDIALVFINLAAEDEYSFYGHLARERLSRTIQDERWYQPEIDPEITDELFKNKVIRRVIALAQVGEHALAQNELKTVYDKIPYNWDESLLALSLELNLPATALTLARNLKERNKTYLTGLYPISNSWKARGGNKIDDSLTYAIIRQESAFDPNVISRAGARGLMQLMPNTAKYIRRMEKKPVYSKHALLKPSINMALGQSYLSYLHEKFEGNLTYMVAGYNAGPGNVKKWIEKIPAIAEDPVLFIESIPFSETRKYVTKVLANLWVYKQRFQQDTPLLAAFSRHQWGDQVADISAKRNYN
jgi:soluble lytic murein transglycosylase-like protein